MLFVGIGGLHWGDIVFSLVLLLLIVIVITVTWYTSRLRPRKQQMNRIEDKLDRLLDKKK
ncbi:hypothetical protein MUN88_09255 [Gracilibacillus caseinilyticus]|uniref:DUF4083 domain-containing protein n=1 Tax=Gracilibacillus caseinilyticus TaxID=2932256 RepID=A0ABY4F115_9BACI|nr:hypothetical protein [Gracilibacillus caseinilyticus]UOQ50218.1 hypothetical protein MUN88_09255 [Gracilibacillus caseinilyticus]